MADELTNALLSSINARVEQVAAQSKIGADKAAQQAIATAEKVVKAAATDLLRKVEKRVDELRQAHSWEPILFACAAVGAAVIGAYIVGWILGSRGVSIWGALGL